MIIIFFNNFKNVQEEFSLRRPYGEETMNKQPFRRHERDVCGSAVNRNNAPSLASTGRFPRYSSVIVIAKKLIAIFRSPSLSHAPLLRHLTVLRYSKLDYPRADKYPLSEISRGLPHNYNNNIP